MMGTLARTHLDRLKIGTSNQYTLDNVPEWLERNTMLRGKPYSFKDHEYQIGIMKDQSQELVIIKPSQVGCSEMSARLSLARVSIINGYSCIYVMPAMHLAQAFAKGRVDPIIEESEYLSQAVSNAVDSTTQKRFNHSFLYFRGAQVGSQAMSVPADLIVADEYDACEQVVLKQYQSRLTHSSFKHQIRLSTPTLPNFGIHEQFVESRRHYRMVKCNHCNEWYWPNFFKHVKVPGWDGDYLTLNKQSLRHIDYQNAYLICPTCGKTPELGPEHREWVCENPEDRFSAAGYHISPFDMPAIITPSYLIAASVEYARKIDWVNINLGLPAEDRESTFSREELFNAFYTGDSASGVRVMGVDMGMTCHIMIADASPDGMLDFVHQEQVPVGLIRDRLPQVEREFNVRVSVIDSMPYTETVMALQAKMPNLYAAVYVRSKNVSMYSLKQYEEQPSEGQELVRQVNINRDKVFDVYMDTLRAGMMRFKSSDLRNTIIEHHLSMKRVKEYSNEELIYTWRKSNEDDHFHHAGVYTLIASKLRGTFCSTIHIPTNIRTFKVAPQVMDADEEFWTRKPGRGI
jgi:hypothetical protein